MYGTSKYMMLSVAVLRDDGLEFVTTIEGNQGDMWYLEKIFLIESDIIQVCNVFFYQIHFIKTIKNGVISFCVLLCFLVIVLFALA